LERTLRLLALAVPYLAVSFGLYLLRSGWAAILLYHAGMLVVGIGLGGARRQAKPVLGGGAAPGVILGLGCLGAGPVLWLCWPLMRGAAGLGAALAELGLARESFAGFAIYYALVNPILEEWYWRGVLGSRARAPTVGDAAFAGYHIVVLLAFVSWPWALGAAVILMGAAWLWRQLATRHGGLWIPTATHALADLSVIVAAALIARGGR
jgi:hypothetical protein